jgi:hypothetical protein
MRPQDTHTETLFAQGIFITPTPNSQYPKSSNTFRILKPSSITRHFRRTQRTPLHRWWRWFRLRRSGRRWRWRPPLTRGTCRSIIACRRPARHPRKFSSSGGLAVVTRIVRENTVTVAAIGAVCLSQALACADELSRLCWHAGEARRCSGRVVAG